MALPKAVQRQAAEADRLVTEFNGEPADTPTLNAPPAEPPPASQAPPPEAPPAEPWEQRYHVLQGKYNAEIPALQGQLQNALTSVGNMGREIDGLKQQLQQAAAQRPVESQVTAQDVETWGPDMLDVTRRAAREEAQQLLQPILQENAQLKSQLAQLQGQTQHVAQTQQEVRAAEYWRELARRVPDWNAMNTDKGFLAWLAVFDPMLKNTRQQVLSDAHNALDIEQVAAFFDAYKATLPPASVPNPRKELERQIVPARGATGTPPGGVGAQQAEIWSQEEIAQFYTDVSKGRYRHNPDEQARMNQAITQAVAEGRVR